MARCEDYPCCGHTDENPCGPQWYDARDAFDTTVHPHALCDHENGDCDVEEDEICEDCGEWGSDCVCSDDPAGLENFGGEDSWLDGSYEE